MLKDFASIISQNEGGNKREMLQQQKQLT